MGSPETLHVANEDVSPLEPEQCDRGGKSCRLGQEDKDEMASQHDDPRESSEILVGYAAL